MESITIYVQSAPMLFHLGGENGKTACKHHRLAKLRQVLHRAEDAGIWCTDCVMPAIRAGREQDERN